METPKPIAGTINSSSIALVCSNCQNIERAVLFTWQEQLKAVVIKLPGEWMSISAFQKLFCSMNCVTEAAKKNPSLFSSRPKFAPRLEDPPAALVPETIPRRMVILGSD
jgi:hypothetical protein